MQLCILAEQIEIIFKKNGEIPKLYLVSKALDIPMANKVFSVLNHFNYIIPIDFMRSSLIKVLESVLLAIRNEAYKAKKLNYGLAGVTRTIYLVLRHSIMD